LQRALSTVFLLGLLLATAAAFAITEHLKLIKSPVYATQVTKTFSPVCHCATDKAEIRFKLRHSDSVTVTIVDASGTIVDTLAKGASVQKGVLATFLWDGHTTAGMATNGLGYQPQVELSKDPRTIRMPNRIAVDTVAPKVRSAGDGAGILITGGHHGIVIRYVLSEHAHASVYLGSHRVVLGHRSRPADKVKWNGKLGGRRLPPGRYVLEVGAVDLAGNETPPAERKRLVVRIRYIALSETSIHVPAGAPFAVKVRAGAPRYTWRFAGAHGTGKIGKKELLHLRAPARRGRYRLVVSEHGHSTAATVIVGRK
jgi:hypothetical protein